MSTAARKALAGLLVFLAAAVPARAVEWRYAHVGNEGDIQTIYVEEAARRIDEASKGKIKFRIFPASQLGGVQEMVDGVRMGSIHLGHHDFASLAAVTPEISVFNAPFIYRDGEHALKATDPKTSKVVRELNEKLARDGGVRIIGRVYRGARHISCKFAVKSPADLAGKPFRAVPLPLWVSMVKGFTAIPTPVEVSELPTALMTGLVVGQENPLTMINANKIYEVQSHISMTGHMHSVLAVFANDGHWLSLSAADRAVIEKALDDTAWLSLKWAVDTDADLIGQLKSRGITFVLPENGLDVAAFEKSVLARIDEDFPSFKPLIDEIKSVR